MCGIYFSLSPSRSIEPDSDTVDLLRARGPDCEGRRQFTVAAGDSKCHLGFYSTVLHLRGEVVVKQPLFNEIGIFCWNGETWLIDGQPVEGNDTQTIFARLVAASNSSTPDDKVRRVLTSIAGPFAFVYADLANRILYYGRDRLGRRSLLQHSPSDGELILCSVSHTSGPREVDSRYIFEIDLGSEHLQPVPHLWEAPFAVNSLVLGSRCAPGESRVQELISHLTASIRLRVLDIPTSHAQVSGSRQAKLAILFSGGLDCTLLARLAHELIPVNESVDLLNVAFENANNINSNQYEKCPDRQTGRRSFAELCSTCPARQWRFVAIDVSHIESSQHRQNLIQLMAPQNTEMDLSISMALHFAARGRGCVGSSSYSTRARVLLSGLGADELFAGYTRHATAYRRGGHASLIAELQLDWSRIGQRNLGRDDRVTSHWGREIRYPYLDESFSKWALELPVWEKCGFGLESALDPAKLLLRLAASKLGLKQTAKEKKRAIQFGARTAGLDGKRRGTDLVM